MCNVGAFDFLVFNSFFRIFPSFCISVTLCLYFCVVFFRFLVKISLWGSSTAGWWSCLSSLLFSSSLPPSSSFTTLRLESCCCSFFGGTVVVFVVVTVVVVTVVVGSGVCVPHRNRSPALSQL